MVCYGSCMFASVFLIANIYTIFSCTNDNNKQEFKNTLTQEQKVLYEKIIQERKNIYYGGFVLGIVLSFIAVYFGEKYLFFIDKKKFCNKIIKYDAFELKEKICCFHSL